MSKLIIYYAFLILSIYNIQPLLSQEIHAEDKYAVVVDAGSTGSRGFVIKFSINAEGVKNVSNQKVKKVEPGLSTFQNNELAAIDNIMPIFIKAKDFIPLEYHKHTSVYIKGTAGFRLLPIESQEALWRALEKGLNTHPEFPFLNMSIANMGTIDGYDEAFYAVIASNFIEGSINAEMIPQEGATMVGALDMGGSSTQLIFHKGNENKDENTPSTTTTTKSLPVKHHDFWSHSWINYGVERMRERIWESLINASTIESSNENGLVYISNPCTFGGYEYIHNDTHVLVGSGDSSHCVKHIEQALWGLEHQYDDDNKVTKTPNATDLIPLSQVKSPKFVDGVEHPPLKGKFYGMSVYFYALDCIRQLGPIDLTEWPNPKIDDLEDAAHAFCAMNYSYVENNLFDKHKYTKNSQLVNDRCFEGLYMVTLLEHAFGLHGQAQNITIALDVKGIEVEWTLGYALVEILPGLWQTPGSSKQHAVDKTNNNSAQITKIMKNIGLVIFSAFKKLKIVLAGIVIGFGVWLGFEYLM